MDDNARPHRASILADVLNQEAIASRPWPLGSPDHNPIEHLLAILGRTIHQGNPSIPTVAALHQKWVLIPQLTIQRLSRSMRHRIQAVINVHGSYTSD